MLTITDLTYRIAGRTLLNRASVTIPAGHTIGLVGHNGTGKSTLLGLIAGRAQPDDGAIHVPKRWRIAEVAQEAPAGARALIDTVLDADTERTTLLAEAETATDPDRLGQIHDRLVDIDAHAAPARAAAILNGLGFGDADQQRPCSDFSGGMRMRVALAATLFLNADLLLLDEPTNHLDLEATLWLEGWLKSYPHTILLVSHDRNLLNRAVDGIVHLEGRTLTAYTGGYDTFERTRRMKLEQQQAQAEKQEAARKHMQAFVDRFRYKASKARQAQSRLKALEKLDPIVRVQDTQHIAFDFPDPEPLPPPLITLDGASVGYGDRPILSGLNLRLDPDDRIALLGANGNGKTTLAKLLSGRLDPMEGGVRRPDKLRCGYFAQHQADEFTPTHTALQEAMRWMPGIHETKVRSHIARFGIGEARAGTAIGSLSGGEKARLLLALITRTAPHILLLDEPTNHLDIDRRQALVEAINAFQGAVVLITHDPTLIELTADRLVLVADGRARAYDGDMDDYRRLLIEQRRAERKAQARDARAAAEETAVPEAAQPGDKAVDKKEARRVAAEQRAQLAPLRKKVQAVEKRIATLEADKARLETQLADPTLYEGPGEKVSAIQIKLGEVEKTLAAAEAEWLEAQEALEEVG